MPAHVVEPARSSPPPRRRRHAKPLSRKPWSTSNRVSDGRVTVPNANRGGLAARPSCSDQVGRRVGGRAGANPASTTQAGDGCGYLGAAKRRGRSARAPPSVSSSSMRSCAHVSGCGTWIAHPPSPSTGAMSDRGELPIMTNRDGSTAWRRRIRPYARSSFVATISTASKCSPSPDRASFDSWSNRSPFVMSITRCISTDRRDRVRRAREELDGMLEHRTAGVDDQLDLGRGHLTARQFDRRFDHRQREGLHAVAEQREVAHLGREQSLIDQVGFDIRRHERGEALVRHREDRLVVPQRVVTVERHEIDHVRSSPCGITGCATRDPSNSGHAARACRACRSAIAAARARSRSSAGTCSARDARGSTR